METTVNVKIDEKTPSFFILKFGEFDTTILDYTSLEELQKDLFNGMLMGELNKNIFIAQRVDILFKLPANPAKV